MDFLRKNAIWIIALLITSLVLLEGPRAILIGAFVAAAIGLFWLLRGRARKPAAARRLEAVPKVVPIPLDRGADAVRPQALERTSLKPIDDPRLAAVILMIQLVRTNGLLTRAERDTILNLMADPLGIGDRERVYEQALQLTDRGRVFTPVAEELVPLFRARLSLPERQQLIDMLGEVANAYGEASDLQREAIVRLKRRLLAPDATAGRPFN
ncbi:TerB family tellurite resistance protein [Labrys sp. KNU-23]|uniref:TerB family tellurite resistance protein n=1 Tax=Labrys sp. KNU-23 TaxID=2789216 RepID=UPI0011EE634A|nr:TerB family tellurite resistance protein [Labrys sp. KNU-23]QEN89785.1 TerB family tellurite resistance protein [Labrys sp. KNU-23]